MRTAGRIIHLNQSIFNWTGSMSHLSAVSTVSVTSLYPPVKWLKPEIIQLLKTVLKPGIGSSTPSCPSRQETWLQDCFEAVCLAGIHLSSWELTEPAQPVVSSGRTCHETGLLSQDGITDLHVNIQPCVFWQPLNYSAGSQRQPPCCFLWGVGYHDELRLTTVSSAMTQWIPEEDVNKNGRWLKHHVLSC